MLPVGSLKRESNPHKQQMCERVNKKKDDMRGIDLNIIIIIFVSHGAYGAVMMEVSQVE